MKHPFPIGSTVYVRTDLSHTDPLTVTAVTHVPCNNSGWTVTACYRSTGIVRCQGSQTLRALEGAA